MQGRHMAKVGFTDGSKELQESECKMEVIMCTERSNMAEVGFTDGSREFQESECNMEVIMCIERSNMAEVGFKDGSRGLQESECNMGEVDIINGSRGLQESQCNMGEVDIINGSREHTQQELRRMSLCQLLSPSFVNLAFNLPSSSCGVIWNVLEEEIALLGENKVHIFNVESDLLSFLGAFFSTALVDTVKANLRHLSKSFLGPHYSLRSGIISIAIKIVNDLFWEYVGCSKKDGPLASFMGKAFDADHIAPHHDGRGGEWQEVQRRKAKGKAESSGREQSRGGCEQQRGSGRGGGRRGGRRELPVLVSANAELHFTDCERVEMVLPAFKTPARAQEQRRRRERTIGERSLLFISHASVVEGPPYNPSVHLHGRVHLYHGSRALSFSSFQARGISPRDSRNEFQAASAFYVTNSVHHAFEHPLHYHPAGSLDNPVAVLIFDVDVQVLHGEAPPAAGDNAPFSVLWFEEPNHEWAAFCEGNMNRTLLKHDYDIVIGHVCNPIPSRYEPLLVDLEGGASLTQIAFCTERAMAWMESCMRRVYFEVFEN